MGVQSNQCEGREIISKMKNPLMIASAEDANVHSMDPILSKKEAFEEYVPSLNLCDTFFFMIFYYSVCY